MIKENLKIKNTLKKLYENQEFENSFEDDVTSWDDNETVYEEYVFKYYMEVGKVLGEGTKTVASINVIITEFTNDGEDKMFVWKEEGYDEYAWYIVSLENEIYEDKLKVIPISIYLTCYAEDEYDNLPLEEKNL